MSAPAGATTSAAQGSSTASGRSTTPLPSAKFLAKLQQQYEQGKHCDTRLRCIVLPETDHQEREQEQEEQSSSSSSSSSSSVKTRKRSAMTAEAPRRSRRRNTNSQQQRQEHEEERNEEDEQQNMTEGEASAPSPHQLPPDARTTEILCHAIVFCARSPYFETSLGGEWNEAQTKTVEVVLEDDQAVEDMKLLIKLCYSGNYARDEDNLSIGAHACVWLSWAMHLR